MRNEHLRLDLSNSESDTSFYYEFNKASASGSMRTFQAKFEKRLLNLFKCVI